VDKTTSSDTAILSKVEDISSKERRLTKRSTSLTVELKKSLSTTHQKYLHLETDFFDLLDKTTSKMKQEDDIDEMGRFFSEKILEAQSLIELNKDQYRKSLPEKKTNNQSMSHSQKKVITVKGSEKSLSLFEFEEENSSGESDHFGEEIQQKKENIEIEAKNEEITTHFKPVNHGSNRRMSRLSLARYRSTTKESED